MMMIDPTKWQKVTKRRKQKAGVYWCIRKDNGDTFAINVAADTFLDIDRCDYYGPVEFLPPKPIPPIPEFNPTLIELVKDSQMGKEGEIFWVVCDQRGSAYKFDGTSVDPVGIAKGFYRVMQ